MRRICPRCKKLRDAERSFYPKPGSNRKDKKRTECKQCTKDKSAARQKKLSALDPRFFVRVNVRHKYGVELEVIDRMRKKQKGKCAVCKKTKKLVIDHCHRQNKLRELLCDRCNVGLSYVEQPEFLERALEYLTKHGSHRWLTSSRPVRAKSSYGESASRRGITSTSSSSGRSVSRVH